MRKMTVVYFNAQRRSVRLMHVTGKSMRDGLKAAIAEFPLNPAEGETPVCVLWGHHEAWQDGDSDY